MIARERLIGQENEGPITENGPALFAAHLINIHQALLSERGGRDAAERKVDINYAGNMTNNHRRRAA